MSQSSYTGRLRSRNGSASSGFYRERDTRYQPYNLPILPSPPVTQPPQMPILQRAPAPQIELPNFPGHPENADFRQMPFLIPRPNFVQLPPYQYHAMQEEGGVVEHGELELEVQLEEELVMVPTGYIVPGNLLIPQNVLIGGNRSKTRIIATKQNFLAVAIASTSDNYYMLLGLVNTKIISFFYDLTAMLNYKKTGNLFTNLDWKHSLPTIHELIPDGPQG